MHPFTENRAQAVGSIGEAGLIQLIRKWLGSSCPPAPHGIGDDCAVLAGSEKRLLVTVDPVILGVHFDDALPPRAAGAKLLKRNLSDIAAMGGRPAGAVVSLLLDPRVRHDWLEAFYRGLAACAREYDVTINGGDMAQAPGIFAASLTLFGHAGVRVLTRTGGKSGDWIYVTGRLGGSVSSGHHHRFVPRLDQGAWLAGRSEVRAMMDVSDGLAKDLWALTPRGAVPAIQAELLPRRRGADVRSAVAEGEDYELAVIVAARADRARFEAAWRRRWPRIKLTCIGRFVRQTSDVKGHSARGGRSKTPPLRDPNPTAGVIDLRSFGGYEHLR